AAEAAGGRQGEVGLRAGRETQVGSGSAVMTVLLIAEHDNAHVKDATAKALTAALAMGGDVHVLVAGNNAEGATGEAAKLKGVAKVLTCEAPQFERPLAEPMAALIVSLAEDYS